jgi:hypothetical protein
MNLYRTIFLLLFIIGYFSCTNQQICNPKAPKKIQSIYMSNCGLVSYAHEIEMNGLTLNCDSITVMNLINDYIKFNLSDTPIQVIDIFRSRRNFDIGETLSQPKEYRNDCVIRIYFDYTINHPDSFVFFDDGKIIYSGNNWKH